MSPPAAVCQEKAGEEQCRAVTVLLDGPPGNTLQMIEPG